MTGIKSMCLGICPAPYDKGDKPSVAINSSKLIVEVHESEGSSSLWWRTAVVDGISIEWKKHGTIVDDHGHAPSVALTDSGVVVEVHDSGHGTVWYWTGQCRDHSIEWKKHARYDDGAEPAVAVNQRGQVVEVHRSNGGSSLWWWLGRLDGTELHWTSHGSIKGDSGASPSVAVNNQGLVVEVHTSGHGTLWYWIGRIGGHGIEWSGHAQYASGTSPSVALDDDGNVHEVHQLGGGLYQRTGKVVADRIEWNDCLMTGDASHPFDDGQSPQLAVSGATAVQVHSSSLTSGLYATASLIFDRSNWMGDNLARIGGKSLRELVLPATHDAGMYSGGGLAILGKTQDLSIYGQLAGGVRYFDLRPRYMDGKFVLFHGKVNGPPLIDVLADVRKFCAEGRKELIILKFSHYDKFDQDVFNKLCACLLDGKTGISQWLYKDARQGARLAELPLSHFAARGTQVQVVFSGQYDFPKAGPMGATVFYRYRDWQDSDPDQGDLTVFDVYSITAFLSTMIDSTSPDPEVEGLPQGQLPKFEKFNGECLKKVTPPDSSVPAAVPCDLFLLSWTITVPTAVWLPSRGANAVLADHMAKIGTNPHGRIVNLLYVDYVEYSRATDIAVLRNGCAPSDSA